MSWDGNGTFSRSNGTQTGATTWANARDAGNKITASQHDLHDQDLADGINACLTKNGENGPTGDFKPTNDNAYDLGIQSRRWQDLFLAGSIKDSNGNELHKFTSVAGAVNEITIDNAATTTAPIIEATGDDAHIGLTIKPKGSGLLDIPIGATGAGKNIAARTNAATPNTKLDMSADELILRDANGQSIRVSTVAVTADLGVVGANGIDAGVQVLSTWYYGWVIYNPTTRTTAALASTSATAPTMPAGYTFKVLVTAARSDASVHFVKYRQLGNEVSYDGALSAVATGAATVETAVSLTTLIPPIALSCKTLIHVSASKAGGVGNTTGQIRTVSGTSFAAITSECNANNTHNDMELNIPNISQNVYYLNTTAGAPDSATVDIDVMGFKLPVGGE